MPLCTVPSAAVRGIDAYPIDVEVDIRFGLPSWTTVGLAETAVKESRDRVIAAIKNCGYSFEVQKITINLSPADVKKQGTGFDLPIAIGLLAAGEVITPPPLQDKLLLGELSLNGELRPVSGILSIAAMAARAGRRHLIVPKDNGREAAVIAGLTISPIASLPELVQALAGEREFPAYQDPPAAKRPTVIEKDFSDIKGQLVARRALEIAVAGGHNVLLIGPPGSGKTMLAERIPTILPPLSPAESIETTKIYSVAGELPPDRPLITVRPFRTVHQSVSSAGLIGGGPHPRPGEISLAHNGVLFLDEFAEFSRPIRELIRQPLESRQVTIARAAEVLTYPASFMLVAACNPCKCGFLGCSHKSCRCTVYDQIAYRNRLSGPLLDRVDLHIEVPALVYEEITQREPGESSAAIRERVLAARDRQRERFGDRGPRCNAQMGLRHLRRFCEFGAAGRELLKQAIHRLGLSARAYDRILKVARTIADLEASESIEAGHIAEAIGYRTLDRDVTL